MRVFLARVWKFPTSVFEISKHSSRARGVKNYSVALLYNCCHFLMAPFQNFQTLQRKAAEYTTRGASRVEGSSLFEVVVRRFQPFLRNATEYSSREASRVEGSPLSQLGHIIVVRHTSSPPDITSRAPQYTHWRLQTRFCVRD